MKLRMTLTIEPEISYRAKAFARAQGRSLSELVETLLARESGVDSLKKNSSENTSFSKKWAGHLKLSSHSDERFDSLRNRYSL